MGYNYLLKQENKETQEEIDAAFRNVVDHHPKLMLNFLATHGKHCTFLNFPAEVQPGVPLATFYEWLEPRLCSADLLQCLSPTKALIPDILLPCSNINFLIDVINTSNSKCYSANNRLFLLATGSSDAWGKQADDLKIEIDNEIKVALGAIGTYIRIDPTVQALYPKPIKIVSIELFHEAMKGCNKIAPSYFGDMFTHISKEFGVGIGTTAPSSGIGSKLWYEGFFNLYDKLNPTNQS